MFALTTSKGRGTAIAATTALLAAGLVGVTGSAAQAAVNTYTASPATAKGSAATSVATTITLTGKEFKSTAGVSKVASLGAGTGVMFATSCGTSEATVVGPVADVAAVDPVPAIYGGVSSVSVVSATKVVITARAIPLGSGSTTLAYKICVYGSATGKPLLGSATFTVYPAPTLSNNGVTPAAGDYRGGETVVLTGTGFTKTATVKVDTVAMTNVKFIDATTLTATMPAKTVNSADNTPDFIITTEGGPSVSDNDYTYTRAVNVSPNVGPLAGGTEITVTGSNFLGLDFAADAVKAANNGADNSVVAFTYAGYVGTAAEDATDATQAAAGTKVCLNVQIVSDTELTCTTPVLLNRPYIVQVVYADDFGVAAVTAVSAITSGSTFTAAAF